ncbi:protein MAIN-LIKE 1-like [Lolium perenne]|uniref:protein MAIN-LIKE 1-like n=1 Tax=Lolium perenne TaxID=4522 RepID=UPI0021F68D18|nr:protein MAIN-LIKE 1-like [Lolium perenne]
MEPRLEMLVVGIYIDVYVLKLIASLMVYLLDIEYDKDHRAFHMTKKRTDLHPLKIRYHGTVDIAYDERYIEFIQPTGFLPFISLVSRGGPNMNATALTALVDRWRPETHTFHLRAGEMTPTLQDVFMILGLPIQSDPLCMNTTSDGWRQQMENLIGMAPPPPEDPKERTPTGASFSWIRTNFGECPEGANEDTIRTYTRVYLWYMLSRTLFADSVGKLAHWCWLKALTVLEHRWSWGTTALAYLYRQVMICCIYYSSIVDWEPYGSYYHIGAGMPDLNPKCLEEARFWLNPAYDDDILDDPIEFDERSEIQKTVEECEVVWDQSHRDEKPVGPLRHLIKIRSPTLNVSYYVRVAL